MSYYGTIYKARLNRVGTNPQERINYQRKKKFEMFLKKSPYKVTFNFNEEDQMGVLKPNTQNELEAVQFLLTKTEIIIPNGTILKIANLNNVIENWLVFWQKTTKASGYNKYYVLRLNNTISWNDKSVLAFLSTNNQTGLQDRIVTKNTDTMVNENDNKYYCVISATVPVFKNTEIVTMVNEEKLQFNVIGRDIVSTNGIQYLTLDPVHIKEENGDSLSKENEEILWIGGDNNVK